MEEQILPHDLDEVLNKTSESIKPPIPLASNIKGVSSENWAPPAIISKNVEYIKPQFEPVKPKSEQKKNNLFIKISNNIERKPKCYLVLLIVLILIILIIFIYYNGLLFIGPFCPNNIKSRAYKNKMTNGGTTDISKPIDIQAPPTNSKKIHSDYDLLSSLKI